MKEYNRAIDWIIYSFRLRNSMAKCRLIINYIIACMDMNSKAHSINVYNAKVFLPIDIFMSACGELILVFKLVIESELVDATLESIANNTQIIDLLCRLRLDGIEASSIANNLESLSYKFYMSEQGIKKESKAHIPNIIQKKASLIANAFETSAIAWNDIIYEPSMEEIGFTPVTFFISNWESITVISSNSIFSDNEANMEALLTFIEEIKSASILDEFGFDCSASTINVVITHKDNKLTVGVTDRFEAHNVGNVHHSSSSTNMNSSMNIRGHINRKRILSEMYGKTLGSIKTTVVNSWNYITI